MRIKKIAFLLISIILLADIMPHIVYNIGIFRGYQAEEFPEESISGYYANKRPLDELDMRKLYGPFINLGSFGLRYDIPAEIRLPKDICYYDEPSDRGEPVYVIPAGTMIRWNDPSDQVGEPIYEAEYGYGTIGFPTLKRGWRYVRPFISGTESNAEDMHYYVRLKDLEEVFQEVQKLPEMSAALEDWDTEEDRRYRQMMWMDLWFYERGIYLSPDLYQQVWYWWDAVLIVVMVGVVVTWKWLPWKRRNGF